MFDLPTLTLIFVVFVFGCGVGVMVSSWCVAAARGDAPVQPAVQQPVWLPPVKEGKVTK